MALNFLTGLDVQGNIDLNKKELQNAVIQNLATDPAVGVSIVGQIIFNTTADTLKQFVDDVDNLGNPGWIEVGTTSGVETVTTTDGTYINLTPNSATSGNVTVTADLSAVDGTSAAGTRFLSKDNTWDVPSFTSPGNGILTVQGSGVLGGTGTFSANQSGNTTISLTHDNTTRTDTTSTVTANVFPVVNSVSTNATGHVTAVDIKTVTVPAASNAAITLTAGAGIGGGGVFTLNQSSSETISFDLDTVITGGVKGSTNDSVKIDTITVDNYGRVTAVSTGATGQVNGVSSGSSATISIGGTAIAPAVSALTAAVSSGSAALATGAQIQTAINTALTGVLQFEGTWNASTNTPTLASGTGTSGDYYIVSVAGTTNLDGITDWEIGDWAVFANTTWTKIDNSQVGDVTGDGVAGRVAFWNSASNITNDAGFTYDATNNNLSVPNRIDAGGLVIAPGGNSSEWNTSYDNMITALNVAGTTTKTLTATQQDGGTLTASWTDLYPGTMTATTLGLGKLEDNTTQTVAANSVSATAGKTYGIQMNASDQLVVNVPWTDSQNLVTSVDESTTNNLKGILVNPTTGNVKVGLDINGLDAVTTLDTTDALAIYDVTANENKKVTVGYLSTAVLEQTTFTNTNPAGASYTINSSTHLLGSNANRIMVELIEESTGATVYTDVTRSKTTGLITFTFASSQSAGKYRALLTKVSA
tara:strand:- start:72 stop:2180 length:2109 start_codon:yes stop_codon:yes gene_type:complete